MNPEEGSLRPQLLDRFGFCVEVRSESDPALRVELIERREAFEMNPLAFCRDRAEGEGALSNRIVPGAQASARPSGLRPISENTSAS